MCKSKCTKNFTTVYINCVTILNKSVLQILHCLLFVLFLNSVEVIELYGMHRSWKQYEL